MQKMKCALVILTAWVGLAGSLSADHYVLENSPNPVVPYTNWATAADNIQAAVNVAVAESTVWVAPGTYYAPDSPPNNTVIDINKSLNLRGTGNNPGEVIIDGNGEYRGIFLNSGMQSKVISIENFTITNGSGNVYGGGIFFNNNQANITCIIANCVISGNQATNGTANTHGGGGVYVNCSGGAVTIISNCLVRGNQVSGTQSVGAGILFRPSAGAIVDSVISENGGTGTTTAGGIFMWTHGGLEDTVVRNCQIVSNTSSSYVGGIQIRGSGSLQNCLIAYNSATYYGGLRRYQDGEAHIENCTIVSNFAATSHGGFNANAATAKYVMRNTIIYHNTAGSYPNWLPLSSAEQFHYNCCTTPIAPGAPEAGNISDDPKFMDLERGDFRLAPDSPCINAGSLQDWMAGAQDLDRHRRVDVFSGCVDMGCYEYIPHGILFKLY